MSRLINADALKIAIVEKGQRSKRYKIGETWELNWSEIENVINCMPTIEERKTGRWIGKYPVTSACSECNYLIHDSKVKVFAYCPNCGAKMEVGT